MPVERRRYQIKGRRLVSRQLAACYGEEQYDTRRPNSTGACKRIADAPPT